MNQNAINYLNDNKAQYSKEVLLQQLRQSGYSENDIAESANFVYDNVNSTVVNFWDFKTKKIYTQPSEKWKDFLLGLLGPWIVGLFLGIVPLLGALVGIILFLFEIYAVFYLWNRRRFISFGLIANFLSGFILFLLIIATLSGGHIFY